MKILLRFFIVHIAYWLLVAWWARVLFVLYHWGEYDAGINLINTFVYGCRLDFSLSCYITSLALLLAWCYDWSAYKLFDQLRRYWQVIALSIYLLITVADLVVYKHWATKLNLTALSFARHPAEVMASIGQSDHLMIVGLVFLISFLGLWWLYRVLANPIQPEFSKTFSERLRSGLAYLGLIGLSFIGIRGGLQLEPINQSSAYFSDVPLYNNTSINATWNLMNKVVNNHGGANPYHFGTSQAVDQVLKDFYQKDTTPYILSKVIKPNIVFILLEGFTADVIPAFGGESGLTPIIDSLVGQGLIWPHFYANGDRTYKGLPSILNGFPTRPVGSIIQNNDLTSDIPSMTKSLQKKGYSSSFYYGGESEFANIKSYLINTGFERIIDIRDFPADYRGIKWGVADHYVFERMAKDLHQEKQPFFSCILTLSSHEPYDIPIAPLIHSKTWPDLFRNTVYYTDQSLGRFLQLAQGQSWFDSTLFVLTADHGNPMPRDYTNNFDPGKFKIPMLIFGPALNDDLKGKSLNKIGSHTDLAYSLLSSLFKNDSLHLPYRFAHQLLDSTQTGSVFYTFDQGFGFVTEQGKMAYDLTADKVVFEEGSVSDSLIARGKLLMQGTFNPHMH